MPPIKPSEIIVKKAVTIPEFVFDAFNVLITKNHNDRTSTVMEKEVVAEILSRCTFTGPDIYNNHWLDVEEVYTKYGWEVEYDKPGYNETYGASFKFTAPIMRDGTRGCYAFDYGTGK